MKVMDNPSVFTITATIDFYPHRIPPRCRKPRRVKETFNHDFAIPSVTSADAPIVAEIPSRRATMSDDASHDTSLRSWNGQLLSTVSRNRWEDGHPAILAGSDDFPAEPSFTVHHTETESETTAEIAKQFEGVVIIDGEVWTAAEEPVYVIHQMGMGHNHGGTLLSTETTGAASIPANCFSLLEHDVAVEAALEAAKERGNDKSYTGIRNTRPARIINPAAFKVPTAAARTASVEAEIRVITEMVGESLRGALTSDLLQESIDRLTEAKTLMWKHAIDRVEAD